MSITRYLSRCVWSVAATLLPYWLQQTRRRGLRQAGGEERGSGKPQLNELGVIQIHDSVHSEHFRVAFVSVQREAVLRGGGVRPAGAESVNGEHLVGVVELDDVSDHADRLFVPTNGCRSAALLVENAPIVVRGVRVVQRGGARRRAVAAREVDADHEVQLEARLDELKEGRFFLEDAAIDGQRAARAVAGEGKRLRGALEKRLRRGAEGAEALVAAVRFVAEELDDDRAILDGEGKGERGNVVAVAEDGEVDGELLPVARRGDFGLEDGNLAALLGFGWNQGNKQRRNRETEKTSKGMSE